MRGRSSGWTRCSNSIWRVADLAFRVAKLLLPFEGIAHTVAGHVPVPQAHIGSLDGKLQPLLRGSFGSLGAAAECNLERDDESLLDAAVVVLQRGCVGLKDRAGRGCQLKASLLALQGGLQVECNGGINRGGYKVLNGALLNKYRVKTSGMWPSSRLRTSRGDRDPAQRQYCWAAFRPACDSAAGCAGPVAARCSTCTSAWRHPRVQSCLLSGKAYVQFRTPPGICHVTSCVFARVEKCPGDLAGPRGLCCSPLLLDAPGAQTRGIRWLPRSCPGRMCGAATPPRQLPENSIPADPAWCFSLAGSQCRRNVEASPGSLASRCSAGVILPVRRLKHLFLVNCSRFAIQSVI